MVQSIFNQPGYIQVPEEGGQSGVQKVKGLLAGLNAPPDSRLMAVNQEQKPLANFAKKVQQAGLGYVQEGGDGPGVMARVAAKVQNMSAGTVRIDGGGRSDTFSPIMIGLNQAPAPTVVELKRRAVQAARQAADAELAQKVAVAKAVRDFERRQTREEARHKAHLDWDAQRGQARGERDNARAAAAEQKVNVVIGSLASGVKSVQERTFNSIGSLLKRRVKVKDTIDGEFVK